MKSSPALRRQFRTPHRFLWLALFTAFAFTASAQRQQHVTGSGNMQTETRNVGRFSAVRVGGAFKVTLTKGSTQGLRIEADDNILAKIDTYVEGNTLVIKIRDNWSINYKGAMRAYVTFTELKALEISGAVNATSESTIETDRFSLDAAGASNVTLPLRVRELDTDCSGATKITLSGSAERHHMDASGATSLYAFDLRTETTKIDLSGASKAEIAVAESLSVEASGASKVTFRGNPRIQNIDASGASKVRKEAE